MAITKIPYCDCTWDLTIGCRKRSPGCLNCWATRTVHRLAAAQVPGYCGDDYACLLQVSLDGKNWEPTERVNLLDWNLDRVPGRKGSFVFINSKSDLFDERVPFSYVLRVWGAMAQRTDRRFMILTKEVARLAEFIALYRQAIRMPAWPEDFRHVILMTSIEDAEHLYRWDQLAAIPAARRGISFESLLGPIADRLPALFAQTRPDWVVVGCEKLLGGRAGRWAKQEPEDWWLEAINILEGAVAAGVAIWMKQGPRYGALDPKRGFVTDDMADFPEYCCIQQHPAWPK